MALHTLSPDISAILVQADPTHLFGRGGLSSDTTSTEIVDWTEFSAVIERGNRPTKVEYHDLKLLAEQLLLLHAQNHFWFVSRDRTSWVNPLNIFWLCINTEDFDNITSLAYSDYYLDKVLATLKLTSIIERSLQDLCFTLSGNSYNMLIQLYKDPKLRELLGGSMMSYLELLMGPPSSLNLRNLVWHGFGSSREHPENFISVLLLLCHYLGCRIESNRIQILHRQPLDVTDRVSVLVQRHSLLFTNGLIDLRHSRFHGSDTKLPYLLKAFELARSHDFVSALQLLLPSFEHIVRVAFAVQNDCVERAVTALRTEFFTTLDVTMESFSAEEIKKTDNSLKGITRPLTSALHDLLDYYDGLRLRDRLSHFEILIPSHDVLVPIHDHQAMSLTECLYTYTHNILVTLLHSLGKRIERVPEDDTENLVPVGTVDIETYLIHHYTPCFHPYIIFTTSLKQAAYQLQTVELELPDETWELSSSVFTASSLFSSCSIDLTHLERFDFIHRTNLKESLRWTHDITVYNDWLRIKDSVKLCKAIAECSSKALLSINEYFQERLVQYRNKNLNSQRRKNLLHLFEHFLTIKDYISAVLKYSMEATEELHKEARPVMRRDKLVLQIAENLAILSEENKWTQCVERCKRLSP